MAATDVCGFADMCKRCLLPSAVFEVNLQCITDASTVTLGSSLAEASFGQIEALALSEFLLTLHKSFPSKEGNIPTQFWNDRITPALFVHLKNEDIVPRQSQTARVKSLVATLRDDTHFVEAVAQLKAVCLERKECLLYADLWAESTFVRVPSVVIVTESPFASVGPISLDLAAMVVNYLQSYFTHMRCEEDNDVHRQYAYRMTDLCTSAVNKYFESIDGLPGSSEEVVSQVAGFAGCLLIARVLREEPAIVEGDLMAELLEAGIRLVNAYQRIKSIGQLVFIALMLC